jgi:pimeloyl-ACP methyl ester carboxylesterase
MSHWILLRGPAREAGHWGAFITSFQARFPRDRLVLVDLPGTGAERLVRSPSSIEEMARRVRESLARRGVSGPCRVLALSMGAAVAVEWARQAPHEIEAAVLVSAAFRPFNGWSQRLRPGSWRLMARLASRRLPPREREAVIYAMTCATRPAPERVIDDWVEIRKRRPVTRGDAWRQLRAGLVYRAPATCPVATPPGRAQVPVLLLAGGRDAVVNPDASRVLAAAWGAARQVHPTAGHDLPFDDGPWVAEAVRRWMAAQEAPSAPPPRT